MVDKGFLAGSERLALLCVVVRCVNVMNLKSLSNDKPS